MLLRLLSPVFWIGCGVIFRLTLMLVLVEFPNLWSTAVAALTSVTAYALWKATLAPKLEFRPAWRTFLLVIGLILGGRL